MKNLNNINYSLQDVEEIKETLKYNNDKPKSLMRMKRNTDSASLKNKRKSIRRKHRYETFDD